MLWRDEDFEIAEDKDTTALDTSLHYKGIYDWGIWTTDLEYTPSFEEFKDYRAKHETALSFPLAIKNWSIRLGVTHDYNSQADEAISKIDTKYFTQLMYRWQ